MQNAVPPTCTLSSTNSHYSPFTICNVFLGRRYTNLFMPQKSQCCSIHNTSFNIISQHSLLKIQKKTFFFGKIFIPKRSQRSQCVDRWSRKKNVFISHQTTPYHVAYKAVPPPKSLTNTIPHLSHFKISWKSAFFFSAGKFKSLSNHSIPKRSQRTQCLSACNCMLENRRPILIVVFSFESERTYAFASFRRLWGMPNDGGLPRWRPRLVSVEAF